MNSCAYYQELISRLVDGEISHDEHEALMAHMNSCSRCNAMYAVFHDLSDILSDETEPLPEGLHENIMADVRRSAIRKKNRRMRAFGLRTAITAAACAVLVLFAATGFEPGKRAESVSVRSEMPAAQAVLTPAPAAAVEANTPAAPETAAPVSTPAPVQTYEPVRTPAPVQVYEPDPIQVYEPVRTPTPVQVYEPVQSYEPEYPDMDSWENPYTVTQPQQYDVDWITAQIQTPAPVQPDTALPFVQPAAPVETPVTEVLPNLQAPSDGGGEIRSNSARAASDGQTQNVPAGNAAADDAPAAEGDSAPIAEELPQVFSLFSSDSATLKSVPPTEEPTAEAEPTEEAQAVPEWNAMLFSAVEEEPVMLFSTPPEAAPAPVQAENLSVYGREARSHLMAMIGNREEALPEDAELTRLVRLSFIPEDSYGSEEKMDIRIYGDFIFCQYYPVDGGTVTYRADCSLKNLDSFLESCRTGQAAATPTPAPTEDPYTVEAPAASPAA